MTNKEFINNKINEIFNESFKAFLVKHNALDNFIVNLKKRLDHVRLDNYCNRVLKESYLFSVFIWIDTSEGYGFWEHLNDLWMDICREKAVFKEL